MNKKINLLVVEDELLIAEHLVYALTQLGYHVVDQVDNALDALAVLSSQKVDLILLDIKIYGDQTGIDLAHKINEAYQIPFLYLTSDTDTQTIALAKETYPAGYIIKPFSSADLRANIEIALHKISVESRPEQPIDIDKVSFNEGVFFIKDKNSFVKVDIREVLFVKAMDNYCVLQTKHKKFVLTQTLKNLAQKIEHFGFLRTHRSFAVNLKMIDKIEDRHIYIGTERMPVSRDNYPILMKKMNLL